jgi:hypothetical protein
MFHISYGALNIWASKELYVYQTRHPGILELDSPDRIRPEEAVCGLRGPVLVREQQPDLPGAG